MEVCTKKFKVRNATEALFVTDMVERVKEVCETYKLPITHIRFGRQVKSWGSTSVADYHIYTYHSDENKIELWINGHTCDLSEEGRKYLEWSTIYGCIGRSLKRNLELTVTKEDLTAFALKYKYKANKKLQMHLQRRLQADLIAGTNYAFIDKQREIELNEQNKSNNSTLTRDEELDAIIAAMD